MNQNTQSVDRYPYSYFFNSLIEISLFAIFRLVPEVWNLYSLKPCAQSDYTETETSGQKSIVKQNQK